MKIAIPSKDGRGLDAPICEDLSECGLYTVVTIREEDNTTSIETVPTADLPQKIGHAVGAMSFKLAGMGVDAIIANSMSEKQRLSFAGNNIRVFTGACGTVTDAVKAFMMGKVEERSDINPCYIEPGKGLHNT